MTFLLFPPRGRLRDCRLLRLLGGAEIRQVGALAGARCHVSGAFRLSADAEFGGERWAHLRGLWRDLYCGESRLAVRRRGAAAGSLGHDRRCDLACRRGRDFMGSANYLAASPCPIAGPVRSVI